MERGPPNNNAVPEYAYPPPHFLNGGIPIQQAAMLPPLSPQIQQQPSWTWDFGNGPGNINYVGPPPMPHQEYQGAWPESHYNQAHHQQPLYSVSEHNYMTPQQYGNNFCSNMNPHYQPQQHSMPSHGHGGQFPPEIFPSNQNQGDGVNYPCTRIRNVPIVPESQYPGGMEIVWRELPEECRRIIRPQDIPETARCRGYFTVCELVALKKCLLDRLGCANDDLDRPEAESSAAGVGHAVREAMDTVQDNKDHQDSENNDTKSEVNSKPLKSDVNGPPGEDSAAPPRVATPQGSCIQIQQSGDLKVHPPPPPPYRRASVTFRQLQIGNFQIRSFSQKSHNLLRVLFNCRRITYECLLTVVRPLREGMPPLRKLLTIDIGFDQISMIRFGIDKVFFRVEGPLTLTVIYNHVNGDTSCIPLSQQDYDLLDQIEKGQLQLTPCHQIYFPNDSLARLLELELRDHPPFAQIIQTDTAHLSPAQRQEQAQAEQQYYQMKQDQQRQRQCVQLLQNAQGQYFQNQPNQPYLRRRNPPGQIMVHQQQQMPEEEPSEEIQPEPPMTVPY